jgi:iron complex outermembrane receptor protein
VHLDILEINGSNRRDLAMAGNSGAITLLFAGVISLIAATPYRALLAQQADQATASAGSGLEEVTVTARRRDEKLQSVPIAVATVSPAEIEERTIVDYADLSVVSGNARYTENYTSLRGLGASSVVTYFAEVPAAGIVNNGGNSLSLGQTFDLESLQVLAGPQGTLFGRSAVGGAILFEPKRPTNNFEGYVQIGLGDYNLKEAEVVANIPIVSDKLMVRFSGQRDGRDGFTKDVGPINGGKDYDNRDYWSGRVGITFRPTDNFENYTLLTYFYNDDHGTGYKLLIINPNGISTFGGLPLAAL